MNTLKMGPAGDAVSSPEGTSDSLIEHVSQQSYADLVIARDGGKKTAKLTETLPGLPALASATVSSGGHQSQGKHSLYPSGRRGLGFGSGKLRVAATAHDSYLLHEPISVVAEKLGPYGLIRIHRLVLVNAAFVEGIRPYSTGEYGLQINGGREHTVTRTYKTNFKLLAGFWIGTGGFFSD